MKGAEVEEDAGDATLSMHALEGSHGVNTIRMLGIHKKRWLFWWTVGALLVSA